MILLYLESFGNPRKFGRIARRVGRTKPIVAVKSGRSAAGARATSSHTGALLAASDVTVDALFRQAGVIRTDTLDELLRRRRAAGQPAAADGQAGRDRDQRGRARHPVRRRVRGAGARGRAAARRGDPGELARVPAARRRRSRNPVDMIASAPAEHYRRALER